MGGEKKLSPRRWAEDSASESARRLRRDMTDAERTLWAQIRHKQVDGYRFRKQVPLGKYVADFACLEPRLIVEVDGGQHADQTIPDAARSAWLENNGFRVLRFWNNEVLENLDGVLQTIAETLREVDDDV